MNQEVIRIEDVELKGSSQGLLYQGRLVIDVERLPDGSDIMCFCDENKNPLPDSPKIICAPVYYY